MKYFILLSDIFNRLNGISSCTYGGLLRYEIDLVCGHQRLGGAYCLQV
jgi:hypothetical protein